MGRRPGISSFRMRSTKVGRTMQRTTELTVTAPAGIRASSLAAFDLDPAKVDEVAFGARAYRRLRVTMTTPSGTASSIMSTEADTDIATELEAAQLEALDEELFQEVCRLHGMDRTPLTNSAAWGSIETRHRASRVRRNPCFARRVWIDIRDCELRLLKAGGQLRRVAGHTQRARPSNQITCM